MRAAGYVLVGGRSTRMGADKALLPYRAGTLVDHVAAEVRAAAGCVTLVGDPNRYRHLGYPVINDRLPGNGPLGGIVAALAASPADWALIVACDMPGVTAALLTGLLDAAINATGNPDCVVPELDSGPEPLCAVYNRRALSLLDSFLDHKFLKMRDAVQSLKTAFVPYSDPRFFRNLNTPEDLQPE